MKHSTTLQTILSLFILLLLTTGLSAQSAKKYFKVGEEFSDNKKHQDAIEQYSKAIDLDADFVEAYIARANSHLELKATQEAIKDYLRALTFDNDNEEYLATTSQLYFQSNDFENAIRYADKTLEEDKKNLEIFEIKLKSQLALEKYKEVLTTVIIALDIKRKAVFYYVNGQANAALENWEAAESSYNQALSLNEDYTEASYELTKAQLALSKKDQAMQTINKIIEKDDTDHEALVIRAKVHKSKLNFTNAIADLSKALLIADDSEKNPIYFERGKAYLEFEQGHPAITDFNTVLIKDGNNMEALYARAAAFEATHQYDKAILDYQKLRKMKPFDEPTSELLKEASKRLFELNREEDPPRITFISPELTNENAIPIKSGLKQAKVSALADDASKITSLKVNGKIITYDKMIDNPEFEFTVVPSEQDKVRIEVTDEYDNKGTYEYAIKETETDTPIVRILSPYASDTREIYLENDNSVIYLEGKIKDESKIKSVFIDGTTASFLIDQLNPSFSATLDISNKSDINILVEDVNGNTSAVKFKLNRDGANLSANNPMGKTWVIFIENSNYSSFASLEGPSKDVREMKSALANYQIHNIIKKKDLTKVQLERFFSIELRDLVRSNKVNSVLVWYAGHGKFQNETGYWIPVDAKRDDEFTYFNINTLKASMQSYSKYITHTLVVTDACESGPSFYQAMRSTETERRCDDWQATRFKSSQVFSSAGYELASDNSQFTRTFANSLQNNPDACIPIDKIVTKVKESVTNEGGQKPQFGKIQGLEDENGTFFFIKK